MNYTCCFTGHRKICAEHMVRLPEVLDRALDILIRSGVTTFRTGGAIGFDTLAALMVLEKKEKHPHISLELCLPCRDQSQKWDDESREAYNYILERADKVTCLHEKYVRGCMHERNRYMVEGSHFCLGYSLSDKSGSAYTLKYAKEKGLKVINFAYVSFGGK